MMRNSGKQHSGMLPAALLACAAVVSDQPDSGTAKDGDGASGHLAPRTDD
jgi:hypothetical protein